MTNYPSEGFPLRDTYQCGNYYSQATASNSAATLSNVYASGSKTENLLEELNRIAYFKGRKVAEKPIVRETKGWRI
jgi:hypothetical protein